jgi:hypothetical protein
MLKAARHWTKGVAKLLPKARILAITTLFPAHPRPAMLRDRFAACGGWGRVSWPPLFCWWRWEKTVEAAALDQMETAMRR